MPRFKADGTRNTIDLTSATLGDDIKDLIQTSTAAVERLYPFLKMEEITFTRTETAYQTFASGKKVKLDGEGGVRTFSGMIVGDDGVEAIARELLNGTCAELDVFEVTVDGNIWGVLDDVTSTDLRGYAVDRETFDSFIQRAVDGATNGIMVSWDLEDDSDTVNSFAITSEELGYKATTLRPLIAATCTATEASTTTISVFVTDWFGSALNVSGEIPAGITGLVTFDFTVTADGSPVTVTAAEVGDGVYTLTHANLDITLGDVVVVSVSATGYDVADGGFTSAL